MAATTPRPPYEDYAAIRGAFAGPLAAAGVAARALGRDPFCPRPCALGEDEEPVPGGMTRAIGELVTCICCVGTRAAAGLAATQILAPRFRTAASPG